VQRPKPKILALKPNVCLGAFSKSEMHKTIVRTVINTFYRASLRSAPGCCLSVRLSVTPWHCVKATQARITKSSPTDRQRTLVFGIKIHPEIRKGSPRARALNESGVGKIRYFQPISRGISETVQDRTKVTIND